MGIECTRLSLGCWGYGGGGGGVWGNCKRGGGEEVNVKAKHNDSHQMGVTLDIEEERII